MEENGEEETTRHRSLSDDCATVIFSLCPLLCCMKYISACSSQWSTHAPWRVDLFLTMMRRRGTREESNQRGCGDI